MKTKYIQPETEITISVLQTSVLQISLQVDNIVDPDSGYEGDDDGTHTPESNQFKLWEE